MANNGSASAKSAKQLRCSPNEQHAAAHVLLATRRTLNCLCVADVTSSPYRCSTYEHALVFGSVNVECQGSCSYRMHPKHLMERAWRRSTAELQQHMRLQPITANTRHRCHALNAVYTCGPPKTNASYPTNKPPGSNIIASAINHAHHLRLATGTGSAV